jgi:hypothetical protein
LQVIPDYQKTRTMSKKTVEELQKELAELRSYHSSAWDTYGSELCAGDMIAQEEKLEKEIAKQKVAEEEQYIKDVSQVLDCGTNNVPEDDEHIYPPKI